MKLRNTNIEILRFVLMCAIFILHTYMIGFGLTSKESGMFTYSGYLPIALSVCGMLVPATYCFVFISGFYGIHFSWKRLLHMLLWLVMVALIYVGYTYYMGHGSLKAIYSSFFPLSHNRWWFITAYISLYLLSPFINAAMEVMSSKHILLVLIIMFSILLYRMIGLVPNAGSDLMGVLLIYILARFMAMKKVVLRMRLAVSLFVICAIVLTAMLCLAFYGLKAFLSQEMTQRITSQLYSYCNPLVITMAVALFYIVYNLPNWTNKYVNLLLSPSIFIYLFTTGVGFVNYKQFASMLINEPDKYVAWLVIVVMVSLLVGQAIMIGSKIIVKSIEPILTPIYRRLSIMITSVFKA